MEGSGFTSFIFAAPTEGEQGFNMRSIDRSRAAVAVAYPTYEEAGPPRPLSRRLQQLMGQFAPSTEMGSHCGLERRHPSPSALQYKSS
jgi:hypothetical protein